MILVGSKKFAHLDKGKKNFCFLIVLSFLIVATTAAAESKSAPNALTREWLKPGPRASSQGLGQDISVAGFLAFAIRNDDWSALYNAKEFNACATSSVGNSIFAKDFGNFAYDCYKARSLNFYTRNDVNLLSNPNSVGRPSFKWNNSTPAELFQWFPERLVRRAAERVSQKSPMIQSLVSGQFSLSFEPFAFLQEEERSESFEARPQYVLFVTETRTLKPSPKPVLVALRDEGIGGYLGDSLSAEYQVVRKRELREVWIPQNRAGTAEEVIFDGWKQDPLAAQSNANSRSALAPKSRPFILQAQRWMGLGMAPFTKFHMKVNRSPINGKESLGLRIAESNDLVFYQLGSLTGKSDNLYGFRLPWEAHSLGLIYTQKQGSAGSSQPLIAYVWRPNLAKKLEASFDLQNKKYSLGYASQL